MNDKNDVNGDLLPAIEGVIKVGNFCWKVSLDELPQLINILKGDLSLIGPRLLLPHYLQNDSKRQNKRHGVLPSIMGWEQVNGRNTISWAQKFDYDVYFVEHLLFALNLKIILKTFDTVINRADINNSDSVDMPEFEGSKNNHKK